jgi:hypothetical protein
MDSLDKYIKLTNKLKIELDRMYTNLQYITVGDLLDESLDLNHIWNKAHKIYEISHKLYNSAYSILEKNPELEGDDLMVDDINSEIYDKVSAIQTIVDGLSDLSSSIDDEEIRDLF